ncbi:MAG TPA: ester cyclase [Streptosporangiaceae bacterium]|nr:ester cyclase [Streptosporangiaceae bacterium]
MVFPEEPPHQAAERQALLERAAALQVARSDHLAERQLGGGVVDQRGQVGQQAVAGSLVRRAFPDLRFTPDVVVSDGQFVAGRWTMTGTNTGRFDLFGLPPTGRPVTMTGQEIFRARDGKFAEVEHQEDAPGMLRQLGLEPPPAIMRLAARRSARRYRRQRHAVR